MMKTSQIFTPPRRDEPEWIDATGHDFALFQASFHDIRIVNRFFGGTSAVLGPLMRMMECLPATPPVSVLDIGTGSADIPLELAARSRRRGRRVEVTALDNHEDVLRVARAAVGNDPAITVAAGDVMGLPYPDGHFDFATCSLTFHHLGEDGCIQAMREMDRVTRYGWVVNDGERAWWTLALIYGLTPLVTRNPLTRHDAVVSMWRAFTPGEMGTLSQRAGFPTARVLRRPVGRIVIVRDKNPSR